MTRIMYDSTDNIIPHVSLDLIAGYVNGSWPSFNSLKGEFPNAGHVSIDVNGTRPDALVRDWETGDKGGNLEQWVINSKTHGNKPVVYCNRSTIAEVRNLTGSQILAKDYWLWVATLDGTVATSFPGAPPGSVVAVQAFGSSVVGFNADRSVVFADWWVAPARPPAPVTTHGTVVQENLVSYPVSWNGKAYVSARSAVGSSLWGGLLVTAGLVTKHVTSHDSGHSWQ